MRMADCKIIIDRNQLAAFCKANGIIRLSLFGSVLRADFNAQSDIDVLVEFAPDQRITYFTLARLESELTELLDRQVDLRLAGELHPRFRDQVIAEAELQYAA